MRSGGELGEAETCLVPLHLSITASDEDDPHRVLATGHTCAPLALNCIWQPNRGGSLGHMVSSLIRYTAQTMACSIIYAIDAHFIAGFSEGCLVSF